MSTHDEHDQPVIGPRPELPPRPPVPDDRIHGDDLEAGRPTPPPTRPTTGPSEPSPPTAQRRRRPWVIAAVGGVILLGSGGLGTGFGAFGTAESSTTLSREQIDAVVLKGGAADVDVVGGAPAGKVEVTTRASRNLFGAGQVRENDSWAGNTLTVERSGCSGFLFGCSVDYTVRVPDGTTVRVESGSGDISAEGNLGALDLRSGSGDVDATNVTARTVTARVGSGDIDLGLANAPDAVTIEAGSGDVDVQVPEGSSYNTDVSTGSGDEDNTLGDTDTAARTLQVRAGSGDVELGRR